MLSTVQILALLIAAVFVYLYLCSFCVFWLLLVLVFNVVPLSMLSLGEFALPRDSLDCLCAFYCF